MAIYETENTFFFLDTYFRTDLVAFKNVADLDNKNSDDKTTYLGIDYSFAFKSQAKDESNIFYFKIERNGPFDYDAPVFVHNTLMNSSGVIEAYRNDELLPQIEEFWLDTALSDEFRFKIGLYTYAVGNGFSLNGAYENYGFTLSRKSENALWRLYYCRPDLVYKNHLGPRIRQEEDEGFEYEHNASNFFATDIKFEGENISLQPYVGVLADYTSPGKRDSVLTAPIKRDILGTLGMAWEFKVSDLTWSIETAHNFGEAKSSDPEYKDVYHTGYFFYGAVRYEKEKLKPSFQFLLASGNKLDPAMASNYDTTLTSGKNRAFSYCSPSNKNLDDSISSSNVDMLPIVAMGGGYGLNYGVPRPRTFGIGDFENLIMPCLGFDYQITDKFCLGVYGYYLRSFEKGIGTFEGEAKYLSRDLGWEMDLFLDYQVNKNLLISFLGGYFIPGKFYKERRDDTEGSLFTSYLRGDGEADPAYQIELAVEFKF